MANILVVDDDHVMLQTMEDWLTFEKHTVTLADSGTRGWEQLQNNEFELIVLDWDMPDLTGIDLLKRFRAEGGTTPVIMLTGHTSLHDKEYGLDSGADDYLTKPFHMKELSARIRANVRRRGPAAPPPATPVPLGQANEEVLKRADLIGTQLAATYEFIDVLGEGGYSVVFRARQPRLKRLVAIKMVRAGKLKDTAIARFEREAQAVTKINHYNVVTFHDFGVTERNLPYIVMEFIEGEELGQMVDRQGPLPLNVAVAILLQLCSGLQEAHSKGIIHRDLKPNNVLLQSRPDRADWVKIVDFGLAHLVEGSHERLTTAGRVMGTPQFLAPERFKGVPADERTDIYSIGVILFEMLTARPLFVAEDTEAVVAEVLLTPRVPPSEFRRDILPGSAFDRMFLRAVDRNPDNRYQSVAEMRQELVQMQSQLQQDRST